MVKIYAHFNNIHRLLKLSSQVSRKQTSFTVKNSICVQEEKSYSKYLDLDRLKFLHSFSLLEKLQLQEYTETCKISQFKITFNLMNIYMIFAVSLYALCNIYLDPLNPGIIFSCLLPLCYIFLGNCMLLLAFVFKGEIIVKLERKKY